MKICKKLSIETIFSFVTTSYINKNGKKYEFPEIFSRLTT